MDMRVDDRFGCVEPEGEAEHLDFLLDEGLELLANYNAIKSLSLRASIRNLLKELSTAPARLSQ